MNVKCTNNMSFFQIFLRGTCSVNITVVQLFRLYTFVRDLKIGCFCLVSDNRHFPTMATICR